MQDQIYPCRLIYIINLMYYTVNADEEAGKKSLLQGITLTLQQAKR